MNRIRQNMFVFGLLIAMVLLNSCETALTTSWGTAFKRNPRKVSVSASNVDDLLKSARGDTDLSKAIFDKTVEKALDPKTSAEEKAVLQNAAITAAKQAAALDTLIMGNIGDILKADSDAELEKLLNSILDGAQGNDIVDISKKLGEMFIDDVVIGDEGPRFKDPVHDGADADTLFIDTVTDTDLVNLIKVAVAAYNFLSDEGRGGELLDALHGILEG